MNGTIETAGTSGTNEASEVCRGGRVRLGCPVFRGSLNQHWFIGKRISEEELKGATRAEYGKEAMMKLAAKLTTKYGAGFDFGSLYKYLAFFKRFKILDSLCPKSGGLPSEAELKAEIEAQKQRFVEQHSR